MKRSLINKQIKAAEKIFEQYKISLPKWANWTIEDYQNNPEVTSYLYNHQMGWDVTDYNLDRFDQRGILLFCVRNGIQGQAHEKPYAEKIMIVHENQETPLHYHKVKMEDIIVRGGGNLILEAYNVDSDGKRLDTPVEVSIDGFQRTYPAGSQIRITPGESITVPRFLMHRFYGEVGTGTVLVGEVSQVNDDHSDNYFFEPLDRFNNVEEDEPVYRPLWNEVAQVLLP